jgi:DNA polymerase III psi subunit
VLFSLHCMFQASLILYELGFGQWNIPNPRVLLGEVGFGDEAASMPMVTR